MSSPFQMLQRFGPHRGLDFKSTDLTRDPSFASDMQNAQYKKAGDVEKRPGYQGGAATLGGKGLFTYNRINPTTNQTVPEMVTVGPSLYKYYSSTLVITYVGVSATAIISIFYDPDTSQYRCQIQEGLVVVLDQALGLGFDEASPYTVNQLNTAIDALANFTSVLTGATTTPAAFIPIVRNYDLSSLGMPLTTSALYPLEVNKTVTSPLGGSHTHRNDADFENASFVQINNVIYISNGYDEVQKYDGQTVYRAGLPTPATLTTALGGAGAVTGTNYFHQAQYIQWDAVGQLVEGNIFTVATGLNPVAQSMNVTVANVLALSGFNTNCAIVNGAQVAVNTITVDDGSGGSHTMKSGDTAYFFDAVSAGYVERQVTAVSGTTITVAGAAVTVADNAVISNNLRIGIYRNETSAVTPTVFFLVDEIPNNSFSATQVYVDNKTDAQLGAQITPPLTDRSTPVKGKYISAFRNQMVIAGNYENQNTVYWSDVESPEYFPLGFNSSDVNTIEGDRISGIAPNNEIFAIFKTRSIYIFSGDIGNNNVRFDQVSNDIGCVAHHTIKEVRGILFFLSDVGPRKMAGGQVPTALGEAPVTPLASRLDPVFEQTQALSENELYVKLRAVAIHDRLKEKYWLFIPAESEDGSNKYANAFSRVFAYDCSRDAWLEWSNINAVSGITLLDEELFFQERRLSTFTGNVDSILYRRHNLNDSWDYMDHASPVDFSYSSQWESLGEPSVFKKFNNIRIFSLDETLNNSLDVTVKIESNFTPGSPVMETMISFTGGGYGIVPYGTSPYGDPSEAAQKIKLSPTKHRSLRVIFENNSDQQNVVISGWEYEVAASYKSAMKR